MFKKYIENIRVNDITNLIPLINHIRSLLVRWYVGNIDSLRVDDSFYTQKYYLFWHYISKNQALPIELVRDNPDANWMWGELSNNPNLTWDFVLRNKDKPWAMYYLSKNKCVTWDIVNSKESEGFNWDYNAMSANPNITWEIINKNNNIPWCMYMFGSNPNITWDIIKNNVEKWDWWIISSNPVVKFENVSENLYYPWDWSNLTGNDGITWEDISRTWNIYPWDEKELCSRNFLTLDIIQNRPDILWDFKKLSWNPNLSIDIIKLPEYKDLWRWHSLSCNKSFKWSDVISTLSDSNFMWNADCLCQNVNIFDVQEEVYKYLRSINFYNNFYNHYNRTRKMMRRCYW